MLVVAGGAALRESVTVDEVAHIGAGLSYLQRLDMRLNPEHPPLAKMAAALPLVIAGARADYSGAAWKVCEDFIPAYGAQWVFGDAVLGRWNAWRPVLMEARIPMLVVTLLLGWVLYRYGEKLGGPWAGLLCLAAYVTTPAFLVFGPLVLTDLPETLFSIVALWRLGEIWKSPTTANARWFGLAFGGALLAKFNGVLLLAVVAVLFIQNRFWPTTPDPRLRWRCIGRGILLAAFLVYMTYLVFTWNQPDDALNLVGHGRWARLIRRPLMPVWVFLRGLFMVAATGSRQTYLFGQVHAHGVAYYFPVVFVLKSTLGFLALLVISALSGVVGKTRAIADAYRDHWRVLTVGFFVFLGVCLISQLDISIRHFMVPIALLILMLAPLPRTMETLPWFGAWQVSAVLAVICSFGAVLMAYPYLFPFINSLAFGRPAYLLVNDSNVTWNEGLPALEDFVRQEHLTSIALDWASLSDPAIVVPEARIWDCQNPAREDAGQWVAVTAISLLENKNCGYLLQYPSRPIAGGAFYAFKLPSPAPSAPQNPRIMWGMPMDLRSWTVNLERHPEQLPAAMQAMIAKYQQEFQQRRNKAR